MLGADETQVTEFVRSWIYGGVENVPIAMKFPVPCRLPVVMLPGMMVSESRGSGAGVELVVTVAVAETTV